MPSYIFTCFRIIVHKENDDIGILTKKQNANQIRFLIDQIHKGKEMVINQEHNKPEAIPAADPAALRESFFLAPLSKKAPTPLATETPISTLGPSGPNEFPVPKVTQAATVLRTGFIADLMFDMAVPSAESSRADRSMFNKLTIRPPTAGTKTTRTHLVSMGSSLNHVAPRPGISPQLKSRISCTY